MGPSPGAMMGGEINDGWHPVAQAAQALHRTLVGLGGHLATATGGLQLPQAPPRLTLPTFRKANRPEGGALCRHGSGALGTAGFASIDATALGHRQRVATEVASLAVAASGGPVSREELGRATWTLLHTTAAQFPDRPTRRQQKDARELVRVLSRTYPCAECSKHFQEIIKYDPPETRSGAEFQMWMCRFHNTVNKSIGKPVFNCESMAYRWGKLDCGEDQDACTIKGR
mmetsp:Transcript_23037/g.63985  ORF Transcript_23037/g.63985 Transcript_23037/m.63985 type:complete len:229 (+) Transcript_23037:244-930(+)